MPASLRAGQLATKLTIRLGTKISRRIVFPSIKRTTFSRALAAAIARHAGARYVVVSDASDYRLELARNAGADAVKFQLFNIDEQNSRYLDSAPFHPKASGKRT